MKKESFKNIVKKQIQILSMNYLINLRSKYSKNENLLFDKELKPYLKSSKIIYFGRKEVVICYEDPICQCKNQL